MGGRDEVTEQRGVNGGLEAESESVDNDLKGLCHEKDYNYRN
jgi:hypothetical protein